MPPYVMSVKDWNENLRPREKAMQFGLSYLSDAELLAILVRSGNKNETCLAMAERMIEDNNGLSGLMDLSVHQLTDYKGIGIAKATEIMASIELVKRINYEKLKESDVIAGPEPMIEWLKKLIGKEKQEIMVVVFLDIKNRVIGYSILYKGTSSEISVSIKDIFNEAMQRKAYKIAVAHNHPSQSVNPSYADDKTTKQLKEAGNLLNIKLVDHIIVGYNDYYSYAMEGKL